MLESITQAAIIVEGQLATLPQPARHHNLVHFLGALVKVVKGFKNERDGFDMNTSVQGFITNTNRFVEREEAARIAFTADQIAYPKKMLFSEDLW